MIAPVGVVLRLPPIVTDANPSPSAVSDQLVGSGVGDRRVRRGEDSPRRRRRPVAVGRRDHGADVRLLEASGGRSGSTRSAGSGTPAAWPGCLVPDASRCSGSRHRSSGRGRRSRRRSRPAPARRTCWSAPAELADPGDGARLARSSAVAEQGDERRSSRCGVCHRFPSDRRSADGVASQVYGRSMSSPTSRLLRWTRWPLPRDRYVEQQRQGGGFVVEVSGYERVVVHVTSGIGWPDL